MIKKRSNYYFAYKLVKHMRRIIAVVVGFIAGMVLVLIGSLIIRELHPMPEDLNIHDHERLLDWKKSIPNKLLMIEIIFHVLAGFLSSFLAARIADSYKFYIGIFIGLLFVVSTIVNAFSLPHSFWMTALDIFGVLIFVYLGAKLGSRITQNI